MLLVGLTGNIVSGKFAVAELLREYGAVIIDSDVLARDAVTPGSAALGAIVDRWGPTMLRSDGTLERTALRRVVLKESDEREALNATVHPEVERMRVHAVADARARGERVVVCDIPFW